MLLLDKIFNWYFRRNSLPYWLVLLLDCAIIYFSLFFVYWLGYRGHYTQLAFYRLSYLYLCFILPICLLCFKIFHTYSGIIRYSSFVDLMRVANANALAMLLFFALHYPIYWWTDRRVIEHINGRQILLIFMLSTVLMGTVRILVKILYDVTTRDARALKAFIYGESDGAVALAKNIRSQRPTKFILRGFISPKNPHPHHTLMGAKVYPINEQLADTIARTDTEAVLVSPTVRNKFRDNQELQDLLISNGIRIFMVEERVLDTNSADASQQPQGAMALKEVSVEDLLPRDEIHVDMKSVAQELAGKRVLITGSAGSIGSEIVRQVASFKPEALMLIDQAETPEHDIRLMMAKEYNDVPAETIVTSICNHVRMEMIFRQFRPEYVFHAAAYKHVPMMEDNPGEAIHNNVYGTRVIADLSAKYGVKKFVMVSTDKAVNPTNIMGCSKRICEIYVQSLDRHLKEHKETENPTQFVTTRFGNVLGSNGSVIPLFREQIKRGGPVTVTDPNIIRFFMLIPEACKLVLEAGTKGNGGEIFVFDMGKPVRIADLAKRMILLSGAKNVGIKYTGLRAGEKLYEEVLNDKEETRPTFNEKIRIASVREYDYDKVCRDIDELVEIAYSYDDMAIAKKMKDIVPEFKSNNSKYEALDKVEN